MEQIDGCQTAGGVVRGQEKEGEGISKNHICIPHGYRQ